VTDRRTDRQNCDRRATEVAAVARKNGETRENRKKIKPLHFSEAVVPVDQKQLLRVLTGQGVSWACDLVVQ